MTEFEKWVDKVWDSLDGLDTIDKMQDAYNAGRKSALEWALSQNYQFFDLQGRGHMIIDANVLKKELENL